MQESPAQIATAVETTAVRPKQRRGFAAMDPDTLRAVCSQGGKTAHKSGRAHRFNPEEASKAGKKGGEALPQTEPTWPPSASEAAKPRRAIEHGKPHYAQPFHCTHRFPNADCHSRRDDANGIAPTLMSTPAKRSGLPTGTIGSWVRMKTGRIAPRSRSRLPMMRSTIGLKR